jgi:hypothetical protein
VITHRISSCEGRSILDHRQFNTKRAFHDTHTKWPFHSSSSTSRSPSIPTPSPASMYALRCHRVPIAEHPNPCHHVSRWASHRLSRVAAAWEALMTAVTGDDDGDGAVSEDRTRPSTSSMQFPRRSSSSSTICKGKVNERTN